jgi:mono/diheme cytochrome c family protein
MLKRLYARWRKPLLWSLAALPVVFGAIQFVPYGRVHAAAPAPHPFPWKSPEAESLARAACYDCHSSETRWWWAVKVAPFSWLAQSDIDEARSRADFSDWSRKPITAERLDRSLHRGMPPIQYTLFHPEARLTEAQKQTLVQGFRSSLVPTVAKGNASPESILQARCADCHSPAKGLQFRASSPDQARTLLDRMIRKGANLPAGEAQTLIAYFTR